MTIKENRRAFRHDQSKYPFYEAEGLLSPAREENGYRDYSEENLAILKRIKLLRSLHIPLEEIKAIQSGAVNLTTVLNRQLAQLTADRESLEKAWEICREMRDEGVLYETLDAQKYLDSMDQNGMQARRSFFPIRLQGPGCPGGVFRQNVRSGILCLPLDYLFAAGMSYSGHRPIRRGESFGFCGRASSHAVSGAVVSFFASNNAGENGSSAFG